MSIVERIDRDINVAVITVSDTRTVETDKGGRLVQEYLADINTVIDEDNYKIVKDDAASITKAVSAMLDKGVDAVITTGGTGIAKEM